MSNDYKRLVRSSNNKVLCGVCGGVGEYLGLDPTVVRLLFILFAFMAGGGILTYFIMAIVMPDE